MAVPHTKINISKCLLNSLFYWSASYKKLTIICGMVYIYLIIIYSKSSVCFSFTHENFVILLYYVYFIHFVWPVQTVQNGTGPVFKNLG